MKHNHDQKDKLISGSAIISIGMHLFCCGIPLLTTILSLLGVTLPNLIEHHHDSNIELYIFIISGLFLALSIYLYIKNECKHKCDHNCSGNKLNKIILISAILLYFVNILWHIFH